MSHVNLKKRQCPLALFLKFLCHFKISLMSPMDRKEWSISCRLIFSHVNKLHVACQFKKRPCRPVQFRGQGSQSESEASSSSGLTSCSCPHQSLITQPERYPIQPDRVPTTQVYTPYRPIRPSFPIYATPPIQVVWPMIALTTPLSCQ